MMNESVSTIEGDAKCQTCNNTYTWHVENRPIHPFNDGSAGATAFLGARRVRDPQTGRKDAHRVSETAPTVVWPTDPVLRVALINKGVLTSDDLRVAEEQLRAAMGTILDMEVSHDGTRGT